MDNRTQRGAMMTISAGLVLAAFLTGCTAFQGRPGLTAKESRMSDEFLRGQVLRYKAEVEEDLAGISKIVSELAPADSPFTPEISASVAAAFAEMADDDMSRALDDFSENLMRYYLFYEQLRERGADIQGLQLNLPSDFRSPNEEKLYSPPVEEPPRPGIDKAEIEAASGDRTRFLA